MRHPPTPCSSLLLLVAASLLAACGDSGASPDPEEGTPSAAPSAAPTPTTDGGAASDASGPRQLEGGTPTTAAALDTWLHTKAYTSWSRESAPHRSTGPHASSVLTYIDPSLEASLVAGNPQHPVGATAVKEFYTNGALSGWAVSVKTQPDSNGGRAWYWYETFDPAPGARASEGLGNPVCTGCHSAGRDYVRTPFPLQ